MKTYKLPKYQITVKIPVKGVGKISSGLSSHICDPINQTDGVYEFNMAISHCIESIILAHASAGINVGSKAYIEGIDTTIDAIFNNM